MMKDKHEQAYSFRLKDAKALYQQKRYEGAFYMGGYAVESILKLAYESWVSTSRLTGHNIGELFKNVNQGIQGKNIKFLDDKVMQKCSLKIKTGYIKEWKPIYRYQGKLTRIYDKNKESDVEYSVFIKDFSQGFLNDVEQICLDLYMEIDGTKRRRR